MKNKVALVLLIIAMTVLCVSSALADSWNVELLGVYDNHGYIEEVNVFGKYAYIINDGLSVIDISNPAEPQLAGYCDTPGWCSEVYVSGNYAYIADGDYGLRIIDISNPKNPQEVGFYDTTDFARGVYVSGEYAYVADEWEGLRIIDISDPSNPIEVGFYDTPWYAEGVHVVGKYAYVADHKTGLHIIDISNPSNPQEVGLYDTIGFARRVYVSGRYAYVADRGGGLRVIDVLNPANPQEIGGYNGIGNEEFIAWDVHISGSYAYLACKEIGLRVIDVSNPANPQEVGFYNTSVYANGVYVCGNQVYLADGDGGLCILEHTDASPIVSVNIPLKKGWNLISFPVGVCFYDGDPPMDQESWVEIKDVGSLGFSSLSEWFGSAINQENAWEMVIGQNGVMDRSLDSSFHSLEYMSPVSSYWVKIGNEGGAIFSLNGMLSKPWLPVSLPTGWVMLGCYSDVGYYDTDSPPSDVHVPEGTKWVKVDAPVADHVFSSIRGSYDLIIGEAGAYDPVLPSAFSSLHFISPGYGYWLKMKRVATLMYSPLPKP